MSEPNLRERIEKATSEDESLSILINAIAEELDQLHGVTDDEEAKVPTRRLAGLKNLADLIEKRKKVREQRIVDVEDVARKMTLYFGEQVDGILTDLKVDPAFRENFINALMVRLRDWDKIREKLLSSDDT